MRLGVDRWRKSRLLKGLESIGGLANVILFSICLNTAGLMSI